MLTSKENFLETRKPQGHPERFVKQYEPFKLVFTPQYVNRNFPKPGQVDIVNSWGVTMSWAEGQIGAFPIHTDGKVVCPDIENWKKAVHKPDVTHDPEEQWDACIAQCEQIDRSKQYVTAFMVPGVFEQLHFLTEMQNCMIGFYESPDEMHELIKYIVEYELECAEVICDHIHPDAMLHHDDWGSQISTFLAPEMFAEFFLEPYRALYGYWKERGVEMIVHHSDSYAETLVPYMIEMGIDVWQGAMRTNNIPKIIEEYGDKLTIMGGLDSATFDYEGVTDESIKKVVRDACDAYGPHCFIPCQSQGAPSSSMPDVYARVNAAIEEYSPIYFKEHGLV